MKESSSRDQGKKSDTEVVGARLCDEADTDQMAKATDSSTSKQVTTQDDEERHALMQVALEINEADKLSKNTPNDSNNAAAQTLVCQGIPSTNSHASVKHVPVQGESTPQNQQDDIQPIMLRRTIPYQRQLESQPGAFSGAPGTGNLERTTTLDYALLEAQRQPNNATSDTTTTTTNNNNNNATGNQQLAVANMVVEEGQMITSADPVNLQQIQQREQNRKAKEKLFVAAMIWLCLVATIIIGFVAGSQKQKEPVLITSTETPTVYGSMEPSEVPSFAPTGVLEELLDNLSDYTLASINNSSDTPQWKAWNWLANHQNITYLPEWRKTQLFALATFFYSFQGERWNPLIKERWMDYEKDECDWFSGGTGFFRDGTFIAAPEEFATLPCNSQGRFTILHLSGLKVDAFLPVFPPEITLLTTLSQINFRSDTIRFSGASTHPTPFSSQFPEEFYKMPSLELLRISLVHWTGQLPSELGQLPALTHLRISLSELTGPIPSELGQLSALKHLDLVLIGLSDQLPSELLQLTALTNLQITDVTGQIPTELGQLSALQCLVLSSSELSGPIPSQLGQLTALTTLSLYTNQLTGLIPSELGLLTSLGSLSLQFNQLTGPIPSELFQMMDLKSLMLSHNQLTGQIPSGLVLLTTLESVWLGENHLHGSIPLEILQLTALIFLRLGGNELHGPIPLEIGRLTALTFLFLHGNQLTGPLPDLQLLTNLKYLRLDENQLTGQLASELGMLTRLGWLEVSENQLSGQLPSELGMLTSCTRLEVSENQLTGLLPSELGLLTNFRVLNLTGNPGLSGTVPEDLCFLQNASCTFTFLYQDEQCVLGFDCTSVFCGCDCPCLN
ncbi:expressed unknown protein [Seminavis robusta]|uniref:L domain-like protein n=1 Tax=Seminavis robusta TaxID=568900 RepID=A0A9N8EGV6_9STRA|nr:expressed unknown protein [Seminavis robusta]|eukprot:Sro1143_g246021.1  (847) ;mRNA; r:29415-31955